MRHFIWAWLGSFLIHALFILVLFYFCKKGENIFLQAGDFDFFYLQPTPQSFSTANSVKSTNIASKQKNKIVVGTHNVSEEVVAASNNIATSTVIENGNGAPGSSTFGNNESKKILSQIRKKIEKAKHYPVMAKNKGIEGKSQIRFQLNNDGSIKNLLLSRSSGFEILDASALEAVKLAAPYPYYPGFIQFDLKFQLSQL